MGSLGAAAAGVATFLFLASVFNPAPSAARDQHVPAIVNSATRSRGEILDALLRAPHPKKWSNLGAMEGAEYVVLVYGSPQGPRYTVCNRLGEVLERDLAADDVYRSFPDLNIPGMRLEPASDGAVPMMLADPVD